MIEQRLAVMIGEAVVAAGLAPFGDLPAIELDKPRQKEFGDFTTNVAMALASSAGKKPREVAEAIVAAFPSSDFVTTIEVAGPGFINFRVTHGWLYDALREIRAGGDGYGRLEPNGKRVQVEYVSANPTGPLHVGTARNAVLGDALANIFAAAGWGVEREYYFNDAGRQMDLFAESVEARYLQRFGNDVPFPEEGYHGDYILRIVDRIADAVGDELVDAPEAERRAVLKERGEELVFAEIRTTLERMGIRMDSWFSEKTLHDGGGIRAVVERLQADGNAYEEDGAIWFRASAFGDEKDRALIKSDGDPTYFAADCAYVVDKVARGFDHLVYVWGADHHGTVKRLMGAVDALGLSDDTVEIVLYQFVLLSRGGEPVKMSKRTGDLITLDELLDEVGADATRFTLLTQSNDSVINFDIEEAKKQSLDNPVYYVQYAHARIASILRKAAQAGIAVGSADAAALDLLTHDAETELLRDMAEMPEQVRVASELRAPHRLTHYARGLSERFHRFYTECRVITDDAELTQARLQLAAGAKQVIANVMAILAVSVPEAMERSDD
ncbi:MAG: arginine--tRNA ligase [Actinomycetota bacterium]